LFLKIISIFAQPWNPDNSSNSVHLAFIFKLNAR